MSTESAVQSSQHLLLLAFQGKSNPGFVSPSAARTPALVQGQSLLDLSVRFWPQVLCTYLFALLKPILSCAFLFFKPSGTQKNVWFKFFLLLPLLQSRLTELFAVLHL